MLNKIKLALAIILVGAISFGSVYISELKKEITHLNTEVDRHKSNSEAYQGMYLDEAENGKVLRLKEIDLMSTNNKLLLKIDSIARANKIKPDKPGTIAGGGSTELKDTATAVISNPTKFKLDTTVVHNKYTKIGVKIDGDSLTTTPTINNFVAFYVYPSMEYRNDYKNFFRRLIRFDFKKVEHFRYSIHNENELIKTTGFAVYKIEE